MSLTEDISDANFNITGYQSDCIFVNNEAHTSSLIICPDQLISPWGLSDIEQLDENQLTPIFDLNPEIVLFGTGIELKLPEAKIIALFAQRGIGLENMNTGAACRTYGILVAEGRRTVAALILE